MADSGFVIPDETLERLKNRKHRAEVSALLENRPDEAPLRGADRFTCEISCGSLVVRIPEPEVPRWLSQLVKVNLPGGR